MKPVELKRQLIREPAQWSAGIASTLRAIDTGGVALLSRPVFSHWVSQASQARCVSNLALRDCSQFLWTHRHDGHLYRIDSGGNAPEQLVPIADGGMKHRVFGNMVHSAGRLWVHDRTDERLLALRSDTFQIVAEVRVEGLVDLGAAAAKVYALDSGGIGVYDSSGLPVAWVACDRLRRPVAIAVHPSGTWIYVLDARVRKFLRFRPNGSFDSDLGNFDDISSSFVPRLIAIDPDGTLFVSDGSPALHEFAPDGGYVGAAGDSETSNVTAISALAFDSQGQLYVGAPQGIAAMNRESRVAGNAGSYYTATIDSGAEGEGAWHRIDLVADIGEGGAVDVFYATASERAVVDAVAGILERPVSVQERVAALDGLLETRWQGPHVLGQSTALEPRESRLVERPTHSVLLRPDTKRYLWVKLVVSGLAPRAAVSVREMRVYYPRLSYLRYLPAAYQEDKVSREFVERFLSMFETALGGLETTIDKVPDLFEPSRTPSPFLDWLAQWLDLAVEEDWPAAVKRELIGKASDLYRRKGTPVGLSDFLFILTGKRPIIQESFQTERPAVLGGSTFLGNGTRIAGQPVVDLPAHRSTSLGRGAVLGATEVRNETTKPVNPFGAAAHKFTVVLDMPRQQFNRQARGLHRVIRDQSPAHAAYDIRLVSGTVVGADGVVGFATLDEPMPMRLGHSTLGRSICARTVWYGPELGIDATLTGATEKR